MQSSWVCRLHEDGGEGGGRGTKREARTGGRGVEQSDVKREEAKRMKRRRMKSESGVVRERERGEELRQGLGAVRGSERGRVIG